MSLKTRRIKATQGVLFRLLLSPFHSMNGDAKGKPMTPFPYVLFNRSHEQLRRIGAHVGKVQARNRRARQQAPAQLPPQTAVVIAPLAQTAAQASRLLDAQFPWLRGSEKRGAPRSQN